MNCLSRRAKLKIKFEFAKTESTKSAKIKILKHGDEYFRDFKKLNENFKVVPNPFMRRKGG